MTDVWELVRREREALVEDLAGLTDEQWELPSLCGGWTVHDVAAHLVDNARTTRLGIVAAMVRARFDFDRQNDAGVAREKGATPAETLDRLRAVVGRRTTPPAPLDSRLVEEVVHGEDVRRPLGLRRDYPTETVERALAHQLQDLGRAGRWQATRGRAPARRDRRRLVPRRGRRGQRSAGVAADGRLRSGRGARRPDRTRAGPARGSSHELTRCSGKSCGTVA